ncbi:hypothetical protein ACP70R_001183 [Stipagrostis hirtigluma subsp. patula]
MRLAAATKPSFFLAKHQPVPASSRAGAPAADRHPWSKQAKNRPTNRAWQWRVAVASNEAEADGGGGEDDDEGHRQQVASAPPQARRRARLSARRRERVRLPDGVSGGDIGEFLRRPAGVEALLNTDALQSFVPAGPGTFTCTLRRIGLLGFEVAPVLDLRVAPTDSDCTVEMLSCRFPGVVCGGSLRVQSQLSSRMNSFQSFMRNFITWGNDGEEPCLDIDVNLEVTLEVYTKPFSLLPLSTVEKPGNLLMQGLLDRLVPMLGEKLLKDYHSWVQQQAEASS